MGRANVTRWVTYWQRPPCRDVVHSHVAYTAADIKMVEDHIAQGERHIIQQEELITRLTERGLPTESADELLAEFRALLQQHWDHRTEMLRSIQGEA